MNPTSYNGHEFRFRDYIRTILSYERDPYVHCLGSLEKANIDSSSYYAYTCMHKYFHYILHIT